MRRPLRKFWFSIHRWLGLTVGALFVLIGLSGSLLVFYRAIDEWLHPDLLLSAGDGESRRPLAEVIGAAEDGLPGEPARALFVDAPRSDRGVWTVWFAEQTDDAAGFTQVYVDPSTAEVTGSRVWGEYLVTWIYRLHHRLLAGDTGETVVGVAGLLLLVSLGTGIYLWWPLWRHSWRAAWAIRGGRRFQYDLHKSAGMVSALFLLILAFTGVYLIFPGWIRPCVTAISPRTVPEAGELRSRPRAGLAAIGADRAVAIAQDAIRDGQLKRLYLPASPDDPYVVRLRRPGEVRRSSGNSRVWLDRYSGEVLAVRDWNRRTAADAFLAWQFPLHNGEAFGLAGRWIVFAAGLSPAVLYVTGCVLWWRKRRSRKRQLRRRGAAAPTSSRPGTPSLSGDERVPAATSL